MSYINPKHELHDHEEGLAHCKVCNGAEGSLPTHCPGRKMTDDEEAAVYAGMTDFHNQRWWLPATVGGKPISMNDSARLTLHLFATSGYQQEAEYPNISADQWGAVVGVLEGTMRVVPMWDEASERQRFENMTYANYLKKREERLAKGQNIANDTVAPSTREQMFVRDTFGDYVVVVYMAAWAGWKMARGGA